MGNNEFQIGEVVYFSGTGGGRQYDDYVRIVKKETHNNLVVYKTESPFNEITIHGLRHSAVSLYMAIIGQKVNLLALAKHFGHTVEEMTKTYAHLFPSSDRDLIQDLELKLYS